MYFIVYFILYYIFFYVFKKNYNKKCSKVLGQRESLFFFKLVTQMCEAHTFTCEIKMYIGYIHFHVKSKYF